MTQTPAPDPVVEPAFDPFKALRSFDCTPAVPLVEVQKVRMSDLAAALSDVRVQGYIEANFGLKMLELVKMVVPLILAAVAA